MAIPKVFVSSTCFDLAEERSQLERFISNYGFQPVLSEYNDVFYNPDEHTHQACVNEVAHCDLFVLIISGRFGGEHKDGDGESITQAEFNAARAHNIPVFAFVKKDVLDAQFYFKENLRQEGEDFAKKIRYPAIHKNEDALNIFSFLESVQRSSVNNAIESYVNFSEIETYLKKQWAGMFFSFLKNRKEKRDVERVSSVLTKLIGSTEKLEILVESLHTKSLGEENTGLLLEEAKSRSKASYFFEWFDKALMEFFGFMDDFLYYELRDSFYKSTGSAVLKANNWIDFINNSDYMRIEYNDDFDKRLVIGKSNNMPVIGMELTNKDAENLESSFLELQKLSEADIESIISEFQLPF